MEAQNEPNNNTVPTTGDITAIASTTNITTGVNTTVTPPPLPAMAADPQMEAMARFGQYMMNLFMSQGVNPATLPFAMPSSLPPSQPTGIESSATPSVGVPPLQRALMPQFYAAITPFTPFPAILTFEWGQTMKEVMKRRV